MSQGRYYAFFFFSLNLVHKLSIGISMELMMVSREIIFLTSDLRLSKPSCSYMKTSQCWDLKYFGWQSTSSDIMVSKARDWEIL